MDQLKDHYARLGLVPSADISVVEATYTILTTKLRSEGAPEADRRLQELKIAYEAIVHGAGGANRVGADWLYALEFYPDLQQIHERLERISEGLAAEYRLGLWPPVMWDHGMNSHGRSKSNIFNGALATAPHLSHLPERLSQLENTMPQTN